MLSLESFRKKISLYLPESFSFECTRCSNCCRLSPGYVFLLPADIKRLAPGFAMDEISFVKRYCRIVDGLTSLTEKPGYDCIFWENGGCSVYENRPIQCRNYPFWISNFASREDFDGERRRCPGLMNGKKVIDADYIYREVYADLATRREHYYRVLEPPVSALIFLTEEALRGEA